MNPPEFILDFRSGVPVYAQLVEQVQAHLANGKLEPGDQLPTVRQLAAELRVNFNTVARAYRMLDEAGLISTQQGRGTYILEAQRVDGGAALRQNLLEAQARRFIVAMKKQGFSPDETKANLLGLLRAWEEGKLHTADPDE